MNNAASPGRSLSKFFVLLFALTVPFWLVGSVTRLQLVPGLPVSALMAFCPPICGVDLRVRRERSGGCKATAEESR